MTGKVLFAEGLHGLEALHADSPETAERRLAHQGGRVAIDGERLEKDLAKLVLTLVELLRHVMEAQAVRRMERGTLSDEQAEKLGQALMAARDKLDELREAFGLEPEDLNLDLGPLGTLL